MPRLTDRAAIRSLLETDRRWSVYALGDLAEGFYERGVWLSCSAPSRALLLLYQGFDPPVLFTLGSPDALRGLLREMGVVPRLHLHVQPDTVPLVREMYRIDDVRFMWRMTLASAPRPRSATDEVVRLGPNDIAALEDLYADGRTTDESPDFFAATMVDQGIYYGVREGGALLAAGGTHLLSIAEGVGAIGNVYTRRDRRGRGYGAAVTAAVARTLMGMGVQTIALNVNQRNVIAMRLYERLGFMRYCAFCEGLAVRHHGGRRCGGREYGMSDLRAEVEELYAEYVECLDDGALERWPELFADVCVYKIIPRENYDRQLPLALMLCESKGMLQDRVEALRRTSVYAPRALRHIVSSVRIHTQDDGSLRVRANYAVLQTLLDDETRVFNAGRYLDTLVREAGRLKFKEKLCVCDTVLVPGSLIYPL